MRVLIAEDDRVSALVLRRAIERMGHEPVMAETGLHAWDAFQSERFLLVISDWMMPGLDGLALSRRIREAQSDHYTYLLLLTARTQRNDRLLALDSGVDDFLTKPLDLAELSARVRVAERIIGWQHELDEMRRKAEYLARYDSLTGVLSRRAWFDAAEQILPAAIALFDIDHFKRINDLYGHPAGDEALRTGAQRIVAAVGEGALVGRLGGEEFGVLFYSDLETARARCESAVKLVAMEPLEVARGRREEVSISGGLAPCLPTVGDPAEAVARAYDRSDRALYSAKGKGRRQVIVSTRAA